jgi:glycine C-acetyltransferase
MVDRRDVIVYDADCHACLMDGIRLHIGKRFKFVHNSVVDCEKQLNRAQKIIEETGGSILVITEGVFGMRGEQGILKEIVALKKDYNFRLLVDDAHGFGTMGDGGRGTGLEQGVQDEVDVYLATFAKSMAGIGAFVASTKKVCDYYEYNARSQVFAKSLPVAIIEGMRGRLKMMIERPELKDKLWENTYKLRAGLKERGFDIGTPSTNVTPVFMKGNVEEALGLVYDMRENHRVFCTIVTYPGVPQGMMLLRMIPTAAHSEEDIKLTLDAFSATSERLAAGQYHGIPDISKV